MTNRLVSSLVATVIMLTLAPGATWALQTETDRIAISELKQKLDSGEKLLLIDVREDWELEENGAIPGAIHIPMAELDMRMKDIPKDIQLVFY
ncbi:MAG: rhodanese-like domain-containing protein [Acidobacteriota bacterium]